MHKKYTTIIINKWSKLCLQSAWTYSAFRANKIIIINLISLFVFNNEFCSCTHSLFFYSLDFVVTDGKIYHTYLGESLSLRVWRVRCVRCVYVSLSTQTDFVFTFDRRGMCGGRTIPWDWRSLSMQLLFSKTVFFSSHFPFCLHCTVKESGLFFVFFLNFNCWRHRTAFIPKGYDRYTNTRESKDSVYG